MWMLLSVFLANAEEDEKKKWDVNNPPGKAQKVSINTERGTWMSLDVSPDGKTVVFDLLGDIYTLPIRGGSANPITSGMAWDMQPQFSPDGSQIVFTSDRDGGDNIWIMDAKGGAAKALTTESYRLLNSPVWSPDGRYIAARKHYTNRRSLGTGEIWLYDTKGGSGLAMTKKESDQKDVGEPIFSADGRYVYFSKDATGGKYFEYNKDPNNEIYAIYRIDRESGDIEKVTGGSGSALRPVPSPDGQTLAFVRRIRGKTHLMLRDLASGSERSLVDNLDHDLQETWAVHGVYPIFTWMPDGKEILYWAKGHIYRQRIDQDKGSIIPFRVVDTREIRAAVQFPQAMGETFQTKALRSAVVSPDGKQVLYESLGQIWIHDVAKGKAKRLHKEDLGMELDPSWSADGKDVLFAAWDDVELGALYRVGARGGKPTKLNVGKGHYREPVFAPDGKSVYYRRIGGGWLRSPLWSGETGIYRYDMARKETERLRHGGDTLHVTTEAKYLYVNQWKDGKRTLQRIDMETEEIRQIAHTEMGSMLRISPDGAWIGFFEAHNVHLASAPRTARSISLSEGGKAIPLKTLSTNGGTDIQFSGDSQRAYWLYGPELKFVDVNTVLQTEEESLVPGGIDLSREVAMDDHEEVGAIRGARLVTMKGKEIIEDGTIMWEGNRIVAVGRTSDVKLPKGAKVYDGLGTTIIPGLIDVHHHGSQASGGIIPQQNWKNLSALSFGVTTVHDPSSDNKNIFAVSEMQKAGKVVAPRTYSTGRILYGAKSRATAKINSLDDAFTHLRRLKAVGAFSVKSYNQPRRDQRQQVLEAARQEKMLVMPEGGSLMMHNLTQIIDGHTGIEHALPVAPLYDDVMQLWEQTNVAYTPTLGVSYGGLMGEHFWYANTNVWENERLQAFVPQSVLDGRARRVKKVPMNEYHHITIAESASYLHKRGVRVQIGAHGQREGLAAHWEMWMFEQGGMSPHEALFAGTIEGAQYIGMDAHIGSLEVGKLADFIVLSQNPLDNLKFSDSVQWTILNGRLYDSATMDQLFPVQEKRRELYFQGEGAIEPNQTQEAHCGCE